MSQTYLIVTMTMVVLTLACVFMAIILIAREYSKPNPAGFYRLTPYIIHFLHTIHRKRDNETVVFISRDCYLLYTLYQKLYPRDPCIYVYNSRTAMKKASPAYIAYMKNIINQNQNGTIWIDTNGTNESFVNFFRYHMDGFDIPLKMLMDCHMKLYGTKVNVYMFDLEDELLRTIPRGVELEFLFRAPYNSIVDVDHAHVPVFETDDVAHNIFTYPQNLFLSRLLTEYIRFDNLVHPSIVIHHEISMYLENERHLLTDNDIKPKYVVCFDIDGVCEPETFPSIRNIMSFLYERNDVAVGVITARPSPLEVPVNSMGLHQHPSWKTPIYFNSRTGSYHDIPLIKSQELTHIATGYGFSEYKNILLLDDSNPNVLTARRHGFSAWQVDYSFIQNDLLSKIKEWLA